MMTIQALTVPFCPSTPCSMWASAARRKTSPKPSKRRYVTNAPTARNATSFTTASAASAATMPGWRSVGLRRRSPNTIVKTIISTTKMGPTSLPTPGAWEGGARSADAAIIVFSCSAM
jgi:hypothetical protein